jgi:hypothetical protein
MDEIFMKTVFLCDLLIAIRMILFFCNSFFHPEFVDMYIFQQHLELPNACPTAISYAIMHAF